MKLGQNFVKYFVRFLGNLVSRKNAFEIYRPLVLTFEVFATRNCLLNKSRNADMFSVEDFNDDEWA